MISQKFTIGNVLLVLAASEVTWSQALVKGKFGGLLLEEGVHIGGAPYHWLAAPVRHLHLLLLILPFSPLENIREVNAEDPAEEDDIHGDDDSEPDAADGEDGEGDAVPVHGQPAGHPAEEENAEEEEGGDVEQRVCAIPLRALRLPGDDEELPGVQEHRVHLHHQAEASICHVLPGKEGTVVVVGSSWCSPCTDGNTKASDHHEVVHQQLIRGALPGKNRDKMTFFVFQMLPKRILSMITF